MSVRGLTSAASIPMASLSSWIHGLALILSLLVSLLAVWSMGELSSLITMTALPSSISVTVSSRLILFSSRSFSGRMTVRLRATRT
jgi:hypothetical protein